MTLQPLHDRVIVTPLAKDTQTASGLILPDAGKHERPDQGTVIAVGPGKLNDQGTRTPVSVTVGQTVFFKKYAADEIEIDGKEYLVITDADIIATIQP